MSILLPSANVSFSSSCELMRITLQLPKRWYDEFSGFLLCADDCWRFECRIVIKQEMLPIDSQPDHNHWEEFDKNPKYFNKCGVVGYVPFGSLRQTSWWNPTLRHITFQIKGMCNPKVGLVPRKNKSRERRVECWEETEHQKTFRIKDALPEFGIDYFAFLRH